MKVYRIALRENDRDIFNEIANGLKTIETRAATIKYKNIKAGDKLEIVCGQDFIYKLVTRAERYPTIDMLLSELPLEKILPSALNREEAYKIFNSFSGNREKIAEYGIMAFILE